MGHVLSSYGLILTSLCRFLEVRCFCLLSVFFRLFFSRIQGPHRFRNVGETNSCNFTLISSKTHGVAPRNDEKVFFGFFEIFVSKQIGFPEFVLDPFGFRKVREADSFHVPIFRLKHTSWCRATMNKSKSQRLNIHTTTTFMVVLHFHYVSDIFMISSQFSIIFLYFPMMFISGTFLGHLRDSAGTCPAKTSRPFPGNSSGKISGSSMKT